VAFVVEEVVDSAVGIGHNESQYQPIDEWAGTPPPQRQHRDVVRDTLHPVLPVEEDATSPFPVVVRTAVSETLKLDKVVAAVVVVTDTRNFFVTTVAIVAVVGSLVGGFAVVFALAVEEKLSRPPSRLTGP